MKKKVLSAVLATLLAGAMFTGCGDSSSSSSSTAGSSEAGGAAESSAAEGGSADVSELQAKLDAYKGVPEFDTAAFEGEAFDAKTAMAGKKWLTIPGTSSNPFNQTICEQICEIAGKVGFTCDLLDNQGAAEEHIAGLNSASQKGYSLVDLQAGPTPETLGAQIQECMDAGVKVVTSHLTGYEQEVSPISANMGAGYYDVAQLLSDWVIVNAGTDAKVLVVVSEEITSTLSMENGIKDEFAKYAPDASVDFVNVAIVDWGSKCQSETENYLSAHPDTDYIISIYDSATQYIVPAVKSTGSSAKIVAYNGTPFAVDYVKTGDIEMLLGEDLQTIAYATVDFEMRTALDMPIVEEPTLLRMWTSENVDEALNADGKCEYGIGYGDSAKLAYEKLWGLS